MRGQRSIVLGAVVAVLVALLPGGASADHRDPVTGGGLVPAVRWAGADRFETAAKLAVETSTASIADPSTSVVLATGRNFPDALAGTYLAGLVRAPILLTERDSIPTSTLVAITGTVDTSLDVDTVYLLGGPLAIGVQVEMDLKALGLDVVRLAGLDRAATAARIATGTPDGVVGEVDGLRTAVVARQDAFPDALVAGAAAAGASLPLLLTATDDLPGVTADALRRLDVEQVVVAGGPVAVSDAVVDELVGLGFQVRRVFGNSRTETAIAFARFNQLEFDFNTDAVGVSRADDFPDALAFAPFAGRERISVTLARDPDTLDLPTRAHLGSIGDCAFDVVYVPGGEVAVSVGVVQAARDALTTDSDCAGVDRRDPSLSQAALTSLGATSVRRAEPVPGDVVVTAVFDEPVTCTGDVPQQFSLVMGDATAAATSLDCDPDGSPAVVVGFPAGSVRTLDGLDLRYQQAGDDLSRVRDLAGNAAASDVLARLADGIVVTTTRDAVDAAPGDGTCAVAVGGECSLRAAVQTANADTDDTIIFVPEGTFDLTIGGADEDAAATGDLDLTAPVTIIGAGAETVVRQIVTDRVVDARTEDAILGNLTVTGGDVPGAEAKGGGVRVASGDLTLSGVDVHTNTAGLAGGGIENAATLVVSGGTIRDNTAGANGGGLHASGDARTIVTGGSVRANAAGGEGGGLWNATGLMAVSMTDLIDNSASGADVGQGGGSLYNDGGTMTVTGSTSDGGVADGAMGSGGGLATAGGTVTIIDSTFIDNTATRAGGAVENAEGSVAMTDSTLRGNDAGSAPGNGGGVHAVGGTTTLTRTTAHDNTAVEGGGVWIGGDGEMTLVDATLEANTATGGDAGTAGERQGGGGAYNDGATLVFVGGEVTDNTAVVLAGSGGGVLNADGDLTIDATTFDGNRAARAGGAIEVDFGTVTIGATEAPTLTDNVATGSDAPGNGGGIHAAGEATVTITDVRATGNTAVEGGALWVGPDATMTVLDGTFEANRATGGDAAMAGERQGGGGAYNDGGTLDIDGGTFRANLAITGNGSGGGILAAGGTTSIDGSMIVGNRADRAGGGVEVDSAAVAVTIGPGTTISGNVASGTNSRAGNGGGVHATAGIVIGAATIRDNSAVEGGGVWVGVGATMALTGTTVVGNVASGGDAGTVGAVQGGGGAYNDGGTLNVTGGRFEGNAAITGNGSGGAILTAGAGTTTIRSSTSFTSNVADRAGGAIENDGANVTVTAATFGLNEANGANSGAGNGGAIHARGGTTTVTGGTISQGRAVEGGGVWIGGDGDLTLSSVTVSGNTATGAAADQGGGGAYVDGAAATLMLDTSASITGNGATGAKGSGGGVLNNLGTVTADTVTIADNTAVRAGGGLEAVDGMTMLNATTITGNAAVGGGTGAPGNGGAIHVSGSAGTVGVTTSQVVSNTAAADGGAVWNGGSAITITRTSLLDNTAAGEGGAVYDQGGTTAVTNATSSGNMAADGGSVYVTTGGAVTLTHVTSYLNLATGDGNELGSGGATDGTIGARNSIVVDGDAGSDACAGGGITSTGGNYAETSCGFGGTNDQTGTAPGLPAAPNAQGVFVPADDAPVVDAASTAAVEDDQLGQDRPSVGFLVVTTTPYDAGSIEVQFASPV